MPGLDIKYRATQRNFLFYVRPVVMKPDSGASHRTRAGYLPCLIGLGLPCSQANTPYDRKNIMTMITVLSQPYKKIRHCQDPCMAQTSWMEPRPATWPGPRIQCRFRCIQICYKSDRRTSISWIDNYDRSRAERVKPREDLTKFKRILKMSIKITLTFNCSSTRSSKANSCRTPFSERALRGCSRPQSKPKQ